MSRIKGSQLVFVVKSLRASGAIDRNNLPPHLERYFQERVLAGLWYPESDFRDLTLMLGRLLEPHVEGNVWRFLGLSGAQRDFASTYASMVKKGDTHWTVERMAPGWRQFRDSGTLKVASLETGRAELALRSYPVMCAELADINAGYFEGVVQASGATDVKVEVIEFDESSARWSMRWHEPWAD
ncbi:MAG: DUF2378 family protein [Myxococcales bacterium]|nr:DUF2378 family protein [Myxococcales bacterium]